MAEAVTQALVRKWRAVGPRGLARAVVDQLFPHRLRDLDAFAAGFEDRTGLELGGPSPIFTARGAIPIYPRARRIDNCTFATNTAWASNEGEEFVFDAERDAGTQFIGEASELGFAADASYDFVASSHCLEHLADPLRGLREWQRVLRPGGLLFLVLPHREGTFDHRRPVTALEHLEEDERRSVGEDDRTHLEEILALHDHLRDPGADSEEAFRQRCEDNLRTRCLHHHVFDTRLAMGVVDRVGLRIRLVEAFRPYHICVIAEQPTDANATVDNRAFLTTGPGLHWQSAFASDR